MATRRHVRQSVISILYAKDIGNIDIDDFKDEILADNKIKNKQYEFANSLLVGIDQNMKDIDDNISKNLSKRSIGDIGLIEKAILRLGTYEILFGGTNKVVVINEAIEIAKELCAPNSPKFLNAVLDKI
ncbi:MAG: Transcription termination protein NusB [uncultured Campylobacterales bacterium]|uniref:Transcription termination protein NusB n=1 Tax=uncultured Campylobacterales bacterium TaxID=352960 RepID=A0A6S6SJP1_9BACT|nr:MAG: Transcription termination protein NusB [uncultured Campylobacterales bacterium]